MKSLAILKTMKHEANQLNAKVNKLQKEDEKVLRTLEQCK